MERKPQTGDLGAGGVSGAGLDVAASLIISEDCSDFEVPAYPKPQDRNPKGPCRYMGYIWALK